MMSDELHIDEQWNGIRSTSDTTVPSPSSNTDSVHTKNPSNVSLPEPGRVCGGVTNEGPGCHDWPAKPSAAGELPARDSDLVTWDGPNDPENPQTWPVRRKWILTIACAVMSLCV
jgi:hypothetical protein